MRVETRSSDTALRQVLSELHGDLKAISDEAYLRASGFAKAGRFFCTSSPIAPAITWAVMFSNLPEHVRMDIWAIAFLSIAAGSLTVSCGVALLTYAGKLQTQAERVLSIELKIRNLVLIEALEENDPVKEGLLIAAILHIFRIDVEKEGLSIQGSTDSVREVSSLRAVLSDSVRKIVAESK